MSNAKKVLFVGIGQFTSILVQFLILSILSRQLSLAENGTYGQCCLYSDLFYNIITIGILNSLYIHLAKQKEKNNNYLSNILCLVSILGFIGWGITFLSSTLLSKFLHNAILLKTLQQYSILVFINFLSNTFNLMNIYYGSLKSTTIASSGAAVLKLFFIFCMIKLHMFSISTLITSLILVSIILLLTQIRIFFGHAKIKKPNLNLNFIKEILIVSYPMGLTNVLGFSYAFIAGSFISYFLNETEYAVYRNGSVELPFIAVITTALGTVYLPIISNLMQDKKFDEVILLKQKLNSIVAAVTFPIIVSLIFLAPELITILLSAKYKASIPIFLVFTIILFIRFTDYQDILLFAGKSKKILASNLLFIISNIVLTFIGIKVAGTIGASIGVLCSTFILAFYLIFQTTHFLKIPVIQLINYKNLFIILLISCILASPLLLISTLALKIIYTVIYLLLCYFVITKLKIVNLIAELKKIVKK